MMMMMICHETISCYARLTRNAAAGPGYDRRYNIGYTEQEKQDLVNLMSVL